jgi:hypothetical protein
MSACDRISVLKMIYKKLLFYVNKQHIEERMVLCPIMQNAYKLRCFSPCIKQGSISNVDTFDFMSKLRVPKTVDKWVNGTVYEVRPDKRVVELSLQKG